MTDWQQIEEAMEYLLATSNNLTWQELLGKE